MYPTLDPNLLTKVTGQMVEIVTEGAEASQLERRMGSWEEEDQEEEEEGMRMVKVQDVVVIGESSVHPEVEEQLLYANNIGHEVSGNHCGINIYRDTKQRTQDPHKDGSEHMPPSNLLSRQKTASTGPPARIVLRLGGKM